MATPFFAWFGLIMFLLSFVFFASLTTYEMVKQSSQAAQFVDTNDRNSSKNMYSTPEQGPPPLVSKKKCFPGCEKGKVNANPKDTNPVDTYRWRCSRKSMYEGGKDGGLCDNITECREPNPTCCCYDFQCESCEE